MISLCLSITMTTMAANSKTETYKQVPSNILESTYYTASSDLKDILFSEESLALAISENPDVFTVATEVTATSYFTFNSATNTIVTYSSSTDAPKSVVIPVQIGGYDVLHIDEYAFAGFQLTSLSFEEGSKLQTIGTYAFYNNVALTGVVDLPDTLESIGNSAFLWTNIYALCIGDDTPYTANRLGIIQDYDNESITSANLAQSRNETALVIGERAYDEENALLIDTSTSTIIQHYPEHIGSPTTVTVPEGILHVGTQAYYQDSHITEVIFPSTLETIQDYAFYKTYMDHIDLGNTVLTRIEKEAFSYCTLTTELTVPTTLQYIGESAFSRSNALVRINGLEDSALEEIGNSGFAYSTSLEAFNMPDTVHTVGTYILRSTGISSLEIPPLLLTLSDGLVVGAKSLTEVNFRGPVEEIGKEAFGGTTVLASITSDLYDNPFETVKKIGSAIFCEHGSLHNSAAKSYSGYKQVVTLPNVEEISNLAFSCTYVPEVHITSQKLKELPEMMFYSTSFLTTVTIPESITSVGASIFAGTSKISMKLAEIRLA